MKTSIITAIFISIIVGGWFISGIYFKDDNKSQNYSTENSDLKKVENSDPDNINDIKVETFLSNADDVDQSIILQGQTKINRSIDIKSETIGDIIVKNFDRGKKVTKGELLIEISMEDRQELLNSFNKEFEKIIKNIKLNKEKRDNDTLKIKEQIELYKIEFNTAKQLVDKGLGSEISLTQASYNLIESETNLKDIDINYETQLISLESQLENIKSKIKNIKIDIEKTLIVSPFEGIIQSSFVEEGDYVRIGNIVANIVDLNPIKIQGFLSETDVNKVSLGTEAIIKISNTKQKKGFITFISPIAETNTRTFEFIIEANNDDLFFKSGLTTTIIIEIDAVRAHKISPSILSLDDDGTVGVKAINKNKEVIFYPIEKVKDTTDGMWVTGLPEEVEIIITGQEYVTTGQQVLVQ